ncbi:MAG: ABC transporter permease [Deltaproteobacteria bacterium]|nr:ABC transporter permease [Deltaproteobacteria bacterium]
MESLRSALATYLATAGGGIAVAFIVLLAVGIVAMTLLYVGSALLVLDRFARVARGWLAPALAGVCVAGFVALLATLESFPSDSVYSGPEWWGTFGRQLGVGVASCALFLVAVGAATRHVSQATLGLGVAGVAALAAGLAIAPLGQAVPLFAVVLAVAIVAWLLGRRSRAGADVGGGSRGFVAVLFAVAAGLLPGAISGWLPESAVEGARAASAGLVGILLGAVVLGLVPLAIAGFLSMRRSVEWFIALRYLVAKRRQVFISAITAICVAGIAAGVWLIIVVLSVMNGFEQTWREEILGNRAHFTVHSSFGPFEDWENVMKTVAAVPGVEAASPYVDAEGMVRGSHGEIASVRLRGVDPASVGRVTDLESDLRGAEGESAPDLVARFAKQGADASAPGIVIGGHLASSMGLAVGDQMLLISPFGGPPTPLGPGPRLKRFTVVGIFESSFYQYDEAFTYTTLEAARDFRKVGAVVDGIEARTTDHYRSRIVGDQVQEALGYPYYTRDWKEVFPAFFQALKTERVMMFLLLTMIMVVAAFVIVATLIMMIMEKSSDIAILKAMGAEDAMIERIFALEGTLIGLCGTALGVAAGIAVTGQLSWIQDRIERITGIDTLPASVYQFSELPSKVDPGQVAGVAVIAMILSLGATLLPSRQGSRIDPAAGLRHE